MNWLIFALGVALAIGGAASIVSGVPYIRMESGWTEVIAGTTALSAGIVTVGLAAILSALRRLEPRVLDSRSPATQDGAGIVRAADPMQPPAAAADPMSDAPGLGSPEPELVPVAFAEDRDIHPRPASRSLEERIWSGPTTASGTAGAERARAAVPLDAYRTTDRSSGTRPAASVLTRDSDPRRRAEAGGSVAPAPRSYARPGTGSPSGSDADVPSLIPPPRSPAMEDAGQVSTLGEAPTVVGRYESGGASYVLFSDGTIEVETEMGTHRFASMQELKAYIDQQDKTSLG